MTMIKNTITMVIFVSGLLFYLFVNTSHAYSPQMWTGIIKNNTHNVLGSSLIFQKRDGLDANYVGEYYAKEGKFYLIAPNDSYDRVLKIYSIYNSIHNCEFTVRQRDNILYVNYNVSNDQNNNFICTVEQGQANSDVVISIYEKNQSN